MKWHTRVLTAAVVLSAAGLAGVGLAADEKEARAAVRKLADAVEKKDDAAVKQGADDIAKKYELEEVMHTFQLRTKKGEGMGEKPGAITPDGIEAYFINLGKLKVAPATKAKLEKEGAAIARAAYLSGAIAEVAERKTPEKKEGNKDPKDWLAWCKDMKAASIELAKAAKDKDPKAVKDAASKVNSSCNNCHGVFRD